MAKKAADTPGTNEAGFQSGGKKYRFVLGKMIVPGVNDNLPITAAEAAVSEEAKAYLLANPDGAIEETV